RPDCLRDYTTAPSEISRFPLMKLMHMPQVSDSGEPNEHSHNALLHVAFPIVQQGRRSRTVISELNTTPMHTPTNASPRHHWSSRHSSGPEWIATPYSAEDLALKPHLLLHAGFNRRFLDVPSPQRLRRLLATDLVEKYGAPLAEIARHVGVSTSAISKAMKRTNGD
ncbi:MAG: hypothetical protein ISS62_00435, partial [Desulfobacteraceae bacterium]|nr:hypothetical protein [Desulfobacteraceae bacterium]